MTLAVRNGLWWGFFLSGFFLGLVLFLRDLQRIGFRRRELLPLVLGGFVLSLMGARLSWVLRFWEYYQNRPPLEAFNPWEGGLDSSGGILFFLGFLLLFSLCTQRSLVILLDAAAPHAGWLEVFTRIGCFLVGDDWGKPTSLPWGVSFGPETIAYREMRAFGLIPQGSSHTPPLHPVQLYFSLLGAGMVLFIRILPAQPGIRGGGALLLYGGGRFLLEFLRGDPSRGIFLGLSYPQWLCLCLCLWGGALLGKARGSGGKRGGG